MQKKLSVLLIDDDDVDAEALFRFFAQQKIETSIVHAVDGIEALSILRNNHPAKLLSWPYVILLDIAMPRMNGIEFLQTIRQDQKLQDNIVFVLTTSNRDEDKFAAYKAGVAGYILKGESQTGIMATTKLLDCYQLVVEFPLRRWRIGKIRRKFQRYSMARYI